MSKNCPKCGRKATVLGDNRRGLLGCNHCGMWLEDETIDIDLINRFIDEAIEGKVHRGTALRAIKQALQYKPDMLRRVAHNTLHWDIYPDTYDRPKVRVIRGKRLPKKIGPEGP